MLEQRTQRSPLYKWKNKAEKSEKNQHEFILYIQKMWQNFEVFH